jgi:hypothetical protein
MYPLMRLRSGLVGADVSRAWMFVSATWAFDVRVVEAMEEDG